MAVNRPPMASWLDSGVALLTSFLILKGWGSGKFPVRCIVSSLSRRYISFSLFRVFEGCFRIRRAPDKQGIFDALEIMFGACCQLTASELHTIFCGGRCLECSRIRRAPDKQGIFDALEIMFGACCQLTASELHTIFCGGRCLECSRIRRAPDKSEGSFCVRFPSGAGSICSAEPFRVFQTFAGT